jgi:hypothetical protein
MTRNDISIPDRYCFSSARKIAPNRVKCDQAGNGTFGMNSFDSFTLAPMSAGDIIDRAVRLYGRNFLALLRIVLAPSLVAYAGSILMSIGMRNASLSRGDERIAITVLLVLGGSLLWAIGKAAFYVVLGGSSRSLVAHFFEGKPILARDVYRAARERVWSLIGATIVVGLLLMGASMIVYLFVVTIGMFFLMLMALIGSESMRGAAGIIFFVVVVAAVLVFLFFVYCRVIYVPQILMVEGKGVFSSIGRSFTLASGQLRRIAALFLFWVYIGWSVLTLLLLPLGFISDWINPFGAEPPAWYNIAWQTVGQLSEILLMPIFMIGCTLLYLDSRVRKEGFDVELLANRTLAQPPIPPPVYPIRHEQPSPKWTGSMWTPAPQQRKSFSTSILGLDDYIPEPVEPIPPADPVLEDAGAEVARKNCQSCGAEMDVEDLFCRRCGSALDQR